jgi:hypothetical protein
MVQSTPAKPTPIVDPPFKGSKELEKPVSRSIPQVIATIHNDGQRANLQPVLASLCEQLSINIQMMPDNDNLPAAGKSLVLYMTIAPTTRAVQFLGQARLASLVQLGHRVVIVFVRPGVNAQGIDLPNVVNSFGVLDALEVVYKMGDNAIQGEYRASQSNAETLQTLARHVQDTFK